MNRQLKFPINGGRVKTGLSGLDEKIFRMLRLKGHPRPLEIAVIVFSMTGNYGFFWLILSALMWLSGTERTAGIFILMPLFLYPTLLINFIIKLILHRERPNHRETELRPLVGVPSSLSFPSSHAAMSFAAAIFMTFFHPGLWPLFFGLAFAMSWSRVYVGVHYPSDVMAGTLVGLVTGGTILWLIT